VYVPSYLRMPMMDYACECAWFFVTDDRHYC